MKNTCHDGWQLYSFFFFFCATSALLALSVVPLAPPHPNFLPSFSLSSSLSFFLAIHISAPLTPRRAVPLRSHRPSRPPTNTLSPYLFTCVLAAFAYPYQRQCMGFMCIAKCTAVGCGRGGEGETLAGRTHGPVQRREKRRTFEREANEGRRETNGGRKKKKGETERTGRGGWRKMGEG